MKIAQEEFSVRTTSRNQMVDITGQVANLVRESGIEQGEVAVFCPHTTGGITINENADPNVVHDILMTLEHVFPKNRAGYQHSEGNSDSHVKSTLVGASERVLIQDGKLVLGTWQDLYFCEFDGPRTRRVIVQVRGI